MRHLISLFCLLLLAVSCGDKIENFNTFNLRFGGEGESVEGMEHSAEEESAGIDGGDNTADADEDATDIPDIDYAEFAEAEAEDVVMDGDVDEIGDDDINSEIYDDADDEASIETDSESDFVESDIDSEVEADLSEADVDAEEREEEESPPNPCVGKICQALDPCHEVGTCDPATGLCSDPLKADGSLCDDRNACTVGDQCIGGVCSAGAPLDCDDSNLCTTDWCDAVNGCKHANNTLTCDDGNHCTENEICAQGSCQSGFAKNCNDGTPNTLDSCDPSTGECVHEWVGCAFDIDCVSDNPCVAGACLPDQYGVKGCVWQDVDGAICSTGNKCTTGDECLNGTCQPGAIVVCDDFNPCTDDTCNPANGCLSSPNTASCEDGNACTINDHCSNGTCQAGEWNSCNDSNPCTADLCAPAEGGCIHTPVDNSCDDNNACTSERCQDGVCIVTGASCHGQAFEASNDLAGCQGLRSKDHNYSQAQYWSGIVIKEWVRNHPNGEPIVADDGVCYIVCTNTSGSDNPPHHCFSQCSDETSWVGCLLVDPPGWHLGAGCSYLGSGDCR